MLALYLAITTLASARLFRLFLVDEITRPFRSWFMNWVVNTNPEKVKGKVANWFDYLIHCPFCLGFWISLSVLGSGYLVDFHAVWVVVFGALAANYVQANLNDKMGDEPSYG